MATVYLRTDGNTITFNSGVGSEPPITRQPTPVTDTDVNAIFAAAAKAGVVLQGPQSSPSGFGSASDNLNAWPGTGNASSVGTSPGASAGSGLTLSQVLAAVTPLAIGAMPVLANRSVVTATTDTALAGTFNRYDASGGSIVVTAPSPAAAGPDGDFHQQFAVSRRDAGGPTSVTVQFPNSVGTVVSLQIPTSDTTKVWTQVTAQGYQVTSDSIPLGQLTTPAVQQSLLTAQSSALTILNAAVANRHYARCNIVVLGDSLTEGQGQTAFNNRYVNVLQNVLRGRFPTVGLTGGGRGYIPSKLTTTMLAATPTYTSPWTATLSDTSEQGGYGPAQATSKIKVSGDKMTIPVNCTSVDILYLKSANGNTLYWSFDGGTTKNTFATSASSIQDGFRLNVVPPTAGANTLEIGWSAGTATGYFEGIVEYNGDENKGIMVHGAGHFGWTSTNWTASAGVSTNWPAAVAALGGGVAPSAIVIELGTNDQGASMALATWATNLTNMLAMIRQATLNVGVPVIFLMATKIQGSASFPMSAYVQAAQQVAATDVAAGNTTAVLDMSQRFPLAQGSAFVAGTDPAGLFSTADHLHLSNKGAALWADTIASGLALGQ